MKIKEKLLFVFLPYLLVSVGFLAIWTFLYKWLVIEWNVILVKESVLLIVFPALFIFFAVHFILRPFLKVYYTQTDEILYSIAFLTMLISCFLVTVNLEKSKEIIELQTIKEVKQFPNEKYFKIMNYDLDRTVKIPEIRSYISSDHELITNLYCVSPFEDVNEIWFGVHYFQSPKRKKSEEKNQQLIREFLIQKEKDYELKITQTPTYFEQIRYSDKYDGFKTAINKVEKVSKPIVLEANFEPFEDRFNGSKYWEFYIFGIGSLIFFLFAMFKKAHRFNYLRWLKRQKQKASIFEKSTGYFNPYWTFRFGIVVGGIAVVFFFIHITFFGLSLMNPTSEDLIAVGSLQYSDLKKGQYWRFLTQIFTFSGVGHLIIDLMLIMFSSLFMMETKTKILRLIAIFFIGSIIGAWTTILLYENTLISGLFFGNMAVLGFLMIENYQLRSLVFMSFFIGMYCFAVPTIIIGGIVSFITGILLFFAFDR